MSTNEKCPKCGKLKKDCTCDAATNPKNRTIQIIHEFRKGKGFEPPVVDPVVPVVDPVVPVVDPVVPPVKSKDDDISLKDLQDQLATEKKKRENYESIIALQAEKTFKEEKAAVLALIPEDKREEIEKEIGDNPEVLEDVKRNLLIYRSVAPPVVPPVTPDPNAIPPVVSKTPEEEFKNELDEFLGQIDDETKRAELEGRFKYDSKDPKSFELAKEKLSDAQMMTALLKQAVLAGGGRVKGGSGPSGKANLIPPVEGMGDFKEYIDTLYGTLRDPSKTQAEKDAANGMLDQMFTEVVKGLRVAKGKYGHAIQSYQIMGCPKCGAVLTGERGEVIDNCPTCGWQKYKKGARIA